jgi:ABC-type transport system involved in multi-copper enzyme maturation permease subunit
MNVIHALSILVMKELYRRKDFYVVFILTALITLILGSINIFNDDKIVRYLKEICLLTIWTAMLVISMALTARQIPSEREQRTLFPLLAKPVSRHQLILGKFLGCWLATGIALGIFYLFFILITASKETDFAVVRYLQAIWLHWWMLGIVISLTLLGSVIFAAPSSNFTITFLVVVGILLLGRHLHKVAMQLPEPSQTIISTVYFMIPHLEFFDIRDMVVNNQPLIPWMPILLASLYAAAYITLFLSMACLAFRRQILK